VVETIVIDLPNGRARMRKLPSPQAHTISHWLDWNLRPWAFIAWTKQPDSPPSATARSTRMNSLPLPQDYPISEPSLQLKEHVAADHLAAIIGRNVRRLREESEWTQEELAKLAGVDRLALQHIEAARREPTIGELWKVSVILQVPCSSLLQPSAANVVAGWH
jgi:DNA-binding XRE family transcriptional regulator